MPINSRAKGARAERAWAHWLNDNLSCNARRGQQYSGLGGQDVVDTAIPDIHWECKAVERLNIDVAMAQAIRDAQGKIPVVAHRKNRSDWLVTVQGRDLRTLCLLIANHVKAQGNA